MKKITNVPFTNYQVNDLEIVLNRELNRLKQREEKAEGLFKANIRSEIFRVEGLLHEVVKVK